MYQENGYDITVMIPSKGITYMVYNLYIYVCATIIVHASLFQNCRFEEVMLRFKGVEDQLKLLFTSGIAAVSSWPAAIAFIIKIHRIFSL